jgi:plasmid stability protein
MGGLGLTGETTDITISSPAPPETLVAQFTVRNLEDDVKEHLKRRAARHGRSMEDEVRQILRNAVKDEERPKPKLGSRIAARFAKVGLDADLPELHGQDVQPAQFDS